MTASYIDVAKHVAGAIAGGVLLIRLFGGYKFAKIDYVLFIASATFLYI